MEKGIPRQGLAQRDGGLGERDVLRKLWLVLPLGQRPSEPQMTWRKGTGDNDCWALGRLAFPSVQQSRT